MKLRKSKIVAFVATSAILLRPAAAGRSFSSSSLSRSLQSLLRVMTGSRAPTARTRTRNGHDRHAVVRLLRAGYFADIYHAIRTTDRDADPLPIGCPAHHRAVSERSARAPGSLPQVPLV